MQHHLLYIPHSHLHILFKYFSQWQTTPSQNSLVYILTHYDFRKGLKIFSLEFFSFILCLYKMTGFPGSSVVRNSPAKQEMKVSSLQKEMTTHSSIFVQEIRWTEETSTLQSMGLQRVRDDFLLNSNHKWDDGCSANLLW